MVDERVWKVKFGDFESAVETALEIERDEGRNLSFEEAETLARLSGDEAAWFDRMEEPLDDGKG